jgi:hypothetical protein
MLTCSICAYAQVPDFWSIVLLTVGGWEYISAKPAVRQGGGATNGECGQNIGGASEAVGMHKDQAATSERISEPISGGKMDEQASIGDEELVGCNENNISRWRLCSDIKSLSKVISDFRNEMYVSHLV